MLDFVKLRQGVIQKVKYYIKIRPPAIITEYPETLHINLLLFMK